MDHGGPMIHLTQYLHTFFSEVDVHFITEPHQFNHFLFKVESIHRTERMNFYEIYHKIHGTAVDHWHDLLFPTLALVKQSGRLASIGWITADL